MSEARGPEGGPVKDADGNWIVGKGPPGKTDRALGGIVVVVGCGFLLFVGGILAAIAVPNFLAMQLRAKRAEAPATLDGIRYAEAVHNAEGGGFLSASSCPSGTPGREQTPWDPDARCTQEFLALGWAAPEGGTRCRFSVTALPSEDPEAMDFEAVAVCDVDGDGELARYVATRANKATLQSPNNVY